eukprot:TRINITY_DN122_c0_g1_i6.p1 TRINITY_DN122_c0_g1~~TRINITY_DN122_c0_g1_i6.p1  ORF type:complete len:288 (-),score=48.57 TRINITY_DN122_c0_g1_i6:2383-3246(-)
MDSHTHCRAVPGSAHAAMHARPAAAPVHACGHFAHAEQQQQQRRSHRHEDETSSTPRKHDAAACRKPLFVDTPPACAFEGGVPSASASDARCAPVSHADGAAARHKPVLLGVTGKPVSLGAPESPLRACDEPRSRDTIAPSASGRNRISLGTLKFRRAKLLADAFPLLSGVAIVSVADESASMTAEQQMSLLREMQEQLLQQEREAAATKEGTPRTEAPEIQKAPPPPLLQPPPLQLPLPPPSRLTGISRTALRESWDPAQIEQAYCPFSINTDSESHIGSLGYSGR